MLRMLVLLIFSYLLCACGHLLSEELDTKTIKIHRTEYGKLANGQTIMQYELMTQSIKLKVITYGGIITHLEVPDKLGNFGDVVLGYDDLAGYEKNEAYFGALIGRYANRINKSEIDIKGHAVAVSSNRPPHQLHGGFKGFDKQVWQATTKNNGDSATLNLSLFSPDGEEGFPGDLHMSVSYTVTHQGGLIIEYYATSDKTTVLNPTQHSYFNLSGNADADVLGHELSIAAEKIIELDQSSIPTGKYVDVANTPFDFNKKRSIKEAIGHTHPQLSIGKGFDHYFVHKQQRGHLTELAHLYEPVSGRSMKVSTTEQGAQLYSANHLNASIIGKGNKAYRKHQGLCIETGQLTNSPAEPTFKTYYLTPETPFYSQTTFSFSAY